MYGIYDRNRLLEGGYLTEGEAIENAAKHFPGEDTRVLTDFSPLRDLAESLYEEYNTQVLVITPIGGDSWVFGKSFEAIRAFRHWGCVCPGEGCGTIADMGQLWAWCRDKGLTCAEFKFSQPK